MQLLPVKLDKFCLNLKKRSISDVLLKSMPLVTLGLPVLLAIEREH